MYCNDIMQVANLLTVLWHLTMIDNNAIALNKLAEAYSGRGLTTDLPTGCHLLRAQ